MYIYIITSYTFFFENVKKYKFHNKALYIYTHTHTYMLLYIYILYLYIYYILYILCIIYILLVFPYIFFLQSPQAVKWQLERHHFYDSYCLTVHERVALINSSSSEKYLFLYVHDQFTRSLHLFVFYYDICSCYYLQTTSVVESYRPSLCHLSTFRCFAHCLCSHIIFLVVTTKYSRTLIWVLTGILLILSVTP